MTSPSSVPKSRSLRCRLGFHRWRGMYRRPVFDHGDPDYLRCSRCPEVRRG